MSEHVGPPPTPGTVRSEPRPSRTPVVVGALVVALVVACAVFAVLRLGGGSLPDALPDELPGGWRATDLIIQDEQGEEASTEEREQTEVATAAAEDVVGVDIVRRSYFDEERVKLLDVTVYDHHAGPFAASIPATNERLGVERGTFELVSEGDVPCQVAWSQVVPEGEEIPDEPPASTTCQLDADGLTYVGTGRTLTPAEVVELLEEVRAAD